jgi:hypothetical protein
MPGLQVKNIEVKEYPEAAPWAAEDTGFAPDKSRDAPALSPADCRPVQSDILTSRFTVWA